MLTEHWTLDSAYRYTHLKYPGGGAEANQNIVSMTLTYRWSRWTISR
jgi:opacity protein-like surface antigen